MNCSPCLSLTTTRGKEISLPLITKMAAKYINGKQGGNSGMFLLGFIKKGEKKAVLNFLKLFDYNKNGRFILITYSNVL